MLLKSAEFFHRLLFLTLENFFYVVCNTKESWNSFSSMFLLKKDSFWNTFLFFFQFFHVMIVNKISNFLLVKFPFSSSFTHSVTYLSRYFSIKWLSVNFARKIKLIWNITTRMSECFNKRFLFVSFYDNEKSS
jgi:hypothetical protein